MGLEYDSDENEFLELYNNFQEKKYKQKKQYNIKYDEEQDPITETNIKKKDEELEPITVPKIKKKDFPKNEKIPNIIKYSEPQTETKPRREKSEKQRQAVLKMREALQKRREEQKNFKEEQQQIKEQSKIKMSKYIQNKLMHQKIDEIVEQKLKDKIKIDTSQDELYTNIDKPKPKKPPSKPRAKPQPKVTPPIQVEKVDKPIQQPNKSNLVFFY
jgi:hypothetical protein